MIAHLIALNLLISADSAAPDVVALTCTGERVSVVDGRRTRTPWRNALRIDLQHGRWCEADCHIQHPIVALKPDFVDLIDEAADGFITGSHLNRANGGYTFLSRGTREGQVVEIGILAQCVRRTQ